MTEISQAATVVIPTAGARGAEPCRSPVRTVAPVLAHARNERPQLQCSAAVSVRAQKRPIATRTTPSAPA